MLVLLLVCWRWYSFQRDTALSAVKLTTWLFVSGQMQDIPKQADNKQQLTKWQRSNEQCKWWEYGQVARKLYAGLLQCTDLSVRAMLEAVGATWIWSGLMQNMDSTNGGSGRKLRDAHASIDSHLSSLYETGTWQMGKQELDERANRNATELDNWIEADVLSDSNLPNLTDGASFGWCKAWQWM